MKDKLGNDIYMANSTRNCVKHFIIAYNNDIFKYKYV